jgi:hypothetical protein
MGLVWSCLSMVAGLWGGGGWGDGEMGSAIASNSKSNNPPTENLSLRSRPAREWNDTAGESSTALLPRLGLKPEANS